MRFVVLSSAEYLPYASMCVESIRAHHPVARIVHMTDDQAPALAGAAETWRSCKLVGDTLIRERMYLLSRMSSEPTAIIDADTLTLRPLDDVWDDEFDIGLTWRDHQPVMPYNIGVMFCRDPGFFAGVVKRMDDDPELAKPFGDQEAVAKEAHCGKWRLKVLQCAEWNNSDTNNDVIPDARMLHYKGNRKQYMARHFERGIWR